MKTASVRTPCECQGRLSAVLDESCVVLSGSVQARGGEPENAPATAMHAGGSEEFQIGWLCPLCGRNTSRSFCRSALQYVESEATA